MWVQLTTGDDTTQRGTSKQFGYNKHRLQIQDLKCHNYQAQRVELIRVVSQHTSVTLQSLLFGNDSLPINMNIEILTLCQHILLTPNNTYHIEVYSYDKT